MNKSNIKLNSFKPKNTLNPNFWNDKKKLNRNVKINILDIVDEFVEGIEVKKFKVKDITLTGSIANYNWSKFSDVDIHIIVDKSVIDVDRKMLDDYFAMKKEEWKTKHSGLKIYNFDTEIYIQDVNEKHSSSGIYSVMNNEWIVEPKPFEEYDIDEKYIVNKSYEFITEIDKIEKTLKTCNDRRKLRGLQSRLSTLFKNLKGKRNAGVNKNGEFDKDNIVYKVIRRQNYLEKVFTLKHNIVDKIYSINEALLHGEILR